MNPEQEKLRELVWIAKARHELAIWQVNRGSADGLLMADRAAYELRQALDRYHALLTA